MKTKIGGYIPPVDVEIIGVQKMLMLISLHLETQTDAKLHVPEGCSQRVRKDRRLKKAPRV
jgi:hypothetical protein